MKNEDTVLREMRWKIVSAECEPVSAGRRLNIQEGKICSKKETKKLNFQQKTDESGSSGTQRLRDRCRRIRVPRD